MFDDHVPFTRAQARAEGITDRRLAGPDFRKVLTGYYLPAEVQPSPIHPIRAALLSHPAGAVASHTSVAKLMGAPVPHDPEEHVTVSDPDDRRQRQGVRCHACEVTAEDVRVIADIPVTAPERTFVDLTAQLALVDQVVLGDWMVAQRHTTPARLLDYCRRSHLRRAFDASTSASYVRARVESPQETRVRMLLVLAGLPEPDLNREVYDDAGRFVARLDHSYRGARLAVEYDGRQHLTDASQWEHDVVRRTRLEELGWRVIVVTSKQLYRSPGHVVEQVWRALRERGEVAVPRPTDDWRAHFPG